MISTEERERRVLEAVRSLGHGTLSEIARAAFADQIDARAARGWRPSSWKASTAKVLRSLNRRGIVTKETGGSEPRWRVGGRNDVGSPADAVSAARGGNA